MSRREGMMRRRAFKFLVTAVLGAWLSAGAPMQVIGVWASENPDELYRKGRFAEAKQAYGTADMDNPKDLRYRYNRGCAAYQSGDFQGAAAAFSSVLRRAEDRESRFRATYNLGNTAFEQGDFSAAADYYKKAILLNGDNEDARHNLELSLRKLEETKNQKSEEPGKAPEPQSPGSGLPPDNDAKQDEERGQEGPEGKDQDKTKNDQTDQLKGAEPGEGAGSGEEGESGQEMGERERKEQKAPQDMAGDLTAREDLPEKQDAGQGQSVQSAEASIDKKKAEALLDNIKEDRSKFLRFLIPEDKTHGVASGKDW